MNNFCEMSIAKSHVFTQKNFFGEYEPNMENYKSLPQQQNPYFFSSADVAQ